MMGDFTLAFSAAGGTVNRYIQIVAPPQGERGVFVGKDITGAELAAEPLVRVPASLVITAAVAGCSDIVTQCCAEVSDSPASDTVLLALFLLTEKARGAESQWQWYLDALPRAGVNALHFDERDMNALTGTPLGRAVEAKLRQLRRQYSCFMATLERWKQSTGVDGLVSFEVYKWAHAIVLSRAISLHSFAETSDSSRPPPHGDCDRALLPYLDMFNHSSHPNAFWTVSSDGSVCVCASSCSSSPRTYAAGQELTELCFSYGHKPNTEWLYEYGFLPPDNSHDAWPYFVEPLGSPELVEIKLMWLQELGLPPRIMLPDPATLHDGQSCIDSAALLLLCLAALDDTSDQFSQTVGQIELSSPYFSIGGSVVDDDEKLVSVPALAQWALGHCTASLRIQLVAMRTAARSSPAASQQVQAYLNIEACMIECIESAILKLI
ncbi:hypothetical protein IW142_000871 [Coemansia sp. RSA 564]|nr:hypothetical protein IW142_000871 [Coemansia sp. RSA 564]